MVQAGCLTFPQMRRHALGYTTLTDLSIERDAVAVGRKTILDWGGH